MTKIQLQTIWREAGYKTSPTVARALMAFIRERPDLNDTGRKEVSRYLLHRMTAGKITSALLWPAVFRAIRDLKRGRSLAIPQPKVAAPRRPQIVKIPGSIPCFSNGIQLVSLDSIPSRIRRFAKLLVEGHDLETTAKWYSTTQEDVLDTLTRWRTAVKDRHTRENTL